MVDTTLRPRPSFSTFLLSDQNAGGDGLSYYNYKRLVRSQKVALLQQRRQETRIPGQIHKPIPLPKPNVQQQWPQVAVSKEDPKHNDVEMQISKTVETKTDSEESPSVPSHNHPHTNISHTTRPPQLSNNAGQYRLSVAGRAKSARFVSRQSDQQNDDTALCMTRPKTAAGAGVGRDKLWKLSPPVGAGARSGSTGCDERAVGLECQQVTPADGTDEELQQQQDGHTNNENIQDLPDVPTLVKCFTWTSATKKAYNEVGWDTKLPPPVSPPPSISVRTVPPDPVSIKFNIKRNEIHPQPWQSLGGTGTWDIVQNRPTSGYQRPNDKNIFCSPFRHTRQLPGYQGFTRGEPDNIADDGAHLRSYNVTSYQPRPTKISRRPNIPGYMGCTLWSNNQPVLCNVGYPKPTNNLQSYTEHVVDENISPFIRKSALSKMVSLNAPYNPFNMVEPVY